MDIFKLSERLMSMDDDVWARHANPWSVYSRFTCLPFIVLALWSRAWIGWWFLIPLALALFWTWYNPRAFSPSTQKDGWAFKGTSGERLFLDRKHRPIPHHHTIAARMLTAISGIGILILLYGLIILAVWPTLLGLVTTIGAKVWFVDRMVWLHEDLHREQADAPSV